MFEHELTRKSIPTMGSLMDFHFGTAVVMEVLWSYPNEAETWLHRALAEAGEENVLSLYDEKHEDPFFPGERTWGGLAIKLHTSEGLKWVLLSHPFYNRAGPLMDRTWWCGDYQPTFTDPVEVA